MDNTSERAEKELLAIVRKFLAEYKTERAQSHVQLNASIERDLGIDSLGRVELFLQIEKAFVIKFPDSVLAEAEDLNDILSAIQHAKPTIKTATPHPVYSALSAPSFNPNSAKTLVEVLIKRTESDPERPHIYLQNEQGQEQILRYKELLESACRVASGLQNQGLKLGETVAIMLPTCKEFFYAFFGIMLAGGVPVPIYPPLRPDRIEEYAVREASILNNAEVRILITFTKVETLGKLLRVFIKSLTSVTTVEQLLNQATKSRLPNITLNTEDPALIQYTSGSTSAPKGVLLNHHNLLSNIRAFGKAAEIGPQDVGVTWLPLYHDMGLIGAWLGSLYHAFPLTVLSPLSFLNRPESWLWAIHYHRGTLSAGPNFAFELCVRKIEPKTIEGLDLSSWRLAFNGAETINPKTLERFIDKFKHYGLRPESVYPVYGLAESTVALTFPPLNRHFKVDTILRKNFEEENFATSVESIDTDDAIHATHVADATKDATKTTKGYKIYKTAQDNHYLQFVSCGKPLPEHEIRIVDNNGREVEERVVGSLQFTGPSSMQGYYQNLVATKAVYHDGWWDTGDFAYMADGEVYITGRKKDLIIKAGRNLYPQEIEEVTAQVSNVRRGCVVAFGIEDVKFGTEKLIVVAETNESKSNVRQRMMAEIIEKVSVVVGIPPDEVVLVSPRTIPKTSSGKLQRSLCKQLYQNKKLSRQHLPLGLQVSKLFLKGTFVGVGSQLKKIAHILYTGYVGILCLIFLPFAWSSLFILKRKQASTVVRFFVRLLLLCAACPIEVKGLENLGEFKTLIFIANHASYIDSLILVSVLPADIAFVVKKEARRWPIIGSAIEKLRYLTVDRMDFSKSLADSNDIIDTLKQDRSIVIYPEGTFSHAPGLRPFKLGAFKISVDTSIPICPISLKGTRTFLRGDNKILSPNLITVTIGKPLVPNANDWDEVMRLHASAREEIVKSCGELALDLVAATPIINE